MTKPLVSVIIPAYNAARTLETTVQSVFGQSLQDFEIVIVDDGSKDNTRIRG
jgi:glycosyltransferase involved in cell wall biosynthesis